MWPLKKNEPEDAADDEAKASRRSLVRRLDIFFASYCVLAYTMKYIDQQAHTNAYVSGMKEDLHLVGNELNMINAMFSVGYAVGTIPSQILVAKFRPSLVIPLFEVTWSLLIMVNAAAKNAGLLYGMRLLIGLLESIAYPGFISTLTAWYTPAELAKRIALVQASSAAGSMFSGYLAAGMLKGMQGVGGLEAWRWLFIFDGCISLPIAIAGFFCIPDHPETTRVKWLRPEHIQQARDRMREIGRAPKGRLTVAKFLKIFKEWPIYLMLAIYPFEIVTSQAISYFALYLKSNPSGRTFTQYQVNLIPTGGQALQIVATLIFASLSDRLGRRWQVLCCQVGLGVIGYILLNDWDSVGFNGQFAGYMLIYCTVGSGALSLTWYSEFCSADAEIRTLIIGLCNGIGYAFIAGFPFIMFPNVQAPRYKVGYKMGLAFYLWTIVGSILIAFLLRRYGRPYTKTATQEAEDESVRSQSREDHGDIERKLEEPVAKGNAKERNRADELVPQLRN